MSCDLETILKKRTVSDFRNKMYELQCNTPLSRIRIYMTTTFNVYIIHCVFLVISNKIINIYLSKNKGITKIEPNISNTFSRKLYSLDYVDK